MLVSSCSDSEWCRIVAATSEWRTEELSRAELLRRCILSGAYVIRHLPPEKQQALGRHFRSELNYTPDNPYLQLQGEKRHFSQAAVRPAAEHSQKMPHS